MRKAFGAGGTAQNQCGQGTARGPRVAGGQAGPRNCTQTGNTLCDLLADLDVTLLEAVGEALGFYSRE